MDYRWISIPLYRCIATPYTYWGVSIYLLCHGFTVLSTSQTSKTFLDIRGGSFSVFYSNIHERSKWNWETRHLEIWVLVPASTCVAQGAYGSTSTSEVTVEIPINYQLTDFRTCNYQYDVKLPYIVPSSTGCFKIPTCKPHVKYLHTSICVHLIIPVDTWLPLEFPTQSTSIWRTRYRYQKCIPVAP